MFLQNCTKLKKKNQHEIMLSTFSLSLIIIWKTAIETWAQEMNGGPGNELGARRAEQFPHLGNYTLTPAANRGHLRSAVRSDLAVPYVYNYIYTPWTTVETTRVHKQHLKAVCNQSSIRQALSWLMETTATILQSRNEMTKEGRANIRQRARNKMFIISK